MSDQRIAGPFRPGPSIVEGRMAIESITACKQIAVVYNTHTAEGQANLLLFCASWKLLGVARRMVAALKADEGREWDAEIHELECAIAEAIGKPQPARPKERCRDRDRADHPSHVAGGTGGVDGNRGLAPQGLR